MRRYAERLAQSACYQLVQARYVVLHYADDSRELRQSLRLGIRGESARKTCLTSFAVLYSASIVLVFACTGNRRVRDISVIVH